MISISDKLRRKANWICQLLGRNCHLTHIIEGTIERTGRKRRRSKQLLEDLKKREHMSIENRNKKQWITMFGELILEKTMKLS